MDGNGLKLFEVQFSHRLYRRNIDKLRKEHYWRFESLIICCYKDSDVPVLVKAHVDLQYDKYTYSSPNSSAIFKHSYDLTNMVVKPVKLPKEGKK